MPEDGDESEEIDMGPDDSDRHMSMPKFEDEESNSSFVDNTPRRRNRKAAEQTALFSASTSSSKAKSPKNRQTPVVDLSQNFPARRSTMKVYDYMRTMREMGSNNESADAKKKEKVRVKQMNDRLAKTKLYSWEKVPSPASSESLPIFPSHWLPRLQVLCTLCPLCS